MARRKAPLLEEATLEHSGEQLRNVHSAKSCSGRPCPIHNRTDHHMRHLPQHWRGDRGIVERICSHGVGHPDPDDPTDNTIHGCDGCCRFEKNRKRAGFA